MKVITTKTEITDASRKISVRWWVGQKFMASRPHGILTVDLTSSISPEYEDEIRAHLYAFERLMLEQHVCTGEAISDGRAVTWLTDSHALMAFLHGTQEAIMSGTMIARHFPVRFKGFISGFSQECPESLEFAKGEIRQVYDYTNQYREYESIPAIGRVCITRRGLVTFYDALLQDSHEGVSSPLKALLKRLSREDLAEATVPQKVLLKRAAKYIGKPGYRVKAFHNAQIPNVYFLMVHDPKGTVYLLEAYHWKFNRQSD